MKIEAIITVPKTNTLLYDVLHNSVTSFICIKLLVHVENDTRALVDSNL